MNEAPDITCTHLVPIPWSFEMWHRSRTGTRFALCHLSSVHTVAEKCDCRRKRRENGDSRTFLRQIVAAEIGDYSRQCGQALKVDVQASRFNTFNRHVYRRFGTSKRFAESDKKEMAELIAIRLQIAEDEYHQETAKLVEQLDEAGRLVEQRERTERRLDSTLREFVRRHEKQLVMKTLFRKSAA